MKKKFIILTLLSIFVLTSGLQCKITSEVANFKPVTLEYWGIYEEPQAIALLTGPYSQRHPKIKIAYRQIREDEYKQKLLEAWAVGQGPDLFMVPSTKIKEYLKFIEPMPATMKSPVEYQKGTIKKETVTEMKLYNGLTPKQVRDTFLDAVYDDVIINDKVYGLPYSVDMLSVYYNRELLRNNNVPLPAKDWTQLIEQAPSLSRLNTDDKLIQSAVALGTTNNIPAVFEIISSIMMQVGVEIGNASGIQFAKDKQTLSTLQFYLSFAQKGVKNYSWAKELPNALDVFAAGKLAYLIGYPYHAGLIRQANPKLDFDTIPMFKPQGTDSVPGYASYWVTVVSKARPGNAENRPSLAWQYLLESTQADNVKPYLSNTANPRTTALKALVQEQKNDPVLGPYATNLLAAKTWYHGYNYTLAEKYFMDMVNQVQSASEQGMDPSQFIGAGANLIQQTYAVPQ